MMKKFLSGLLVSALVLGTVSAVNTTTAEAATKVPKAAYTFNMNKANKNVAIVSRQGDDPSTLTPKDTSKGGVMPTEAAAKGLKLKYAAGKNGKCLYLDRNISAGKSYGAQLKGVNVGTGSWSVAFWIKVPNGMGAFNAAFFAATDLTAAGAKWLSITKFAEPAETGGTPVIWSRDAKAVYDKNDGEFPWYCKNGTNDKGEAVWTKGTAFDSTGWVHVVLVVDHNKKSYVQYNEKGNGGYTKAGYHGYTYINGKLYGNGAVAKGAVSSKTKFFLGINGWDLPMKAYYDDVTFWKTALTGKQVKQLYKDKGLVK